MRGWGVREGSGGALGVSRKEWREERREERVEEGRGMEGDRMEE